MIEGFFFVLKEVVYKHSGLHVASCGPGTSSGDWLSGTNRVDDDFDDAHIALKQELLVFVDSGILVEVHIGFHTGVEMLVFVDSVFPPLVGAGSGRQVTRVRVDKRHVLAELVRTRLPPRPRLPKRPT